MRTDCRQRGFTLIELLVAITILAIVAVLSWRGLDGIVRARAALNEETTQTRGMQLTFAQLQSDCSQLATPAMIGNRPLVDISADRLLLIRTAYADQQAGSLRVVSYRLLNGTLTRQESDGTRDLDTLTASWQSALNDALPTPPVPLQEKLSTVSLRLWEARGSWRDPPAVAAAGSSRQTYTGLEVSLFSTGKTPPVTKVLLLGAAG